MLQQRYRKQRELREQRARQRKINHFTKKRNHMHWGMYAADEEKDTAGLQFDCVYTACQIKLRHRYVEVEVTYRYHATEQEAEYYFPISEIGAVQHIAVTWKQGGPAVEMERMEGRLYEQLENGETRPWEQPKPIDEEIPDDVSEASEKSSLISRMVYGDPKKKAIAEVKKARRAEESKKMFYFFGTSPGLKSLTRNKDVVVKVAYCVATTAERQKYDDAILTNFYLPLTIFAHPPNRWDISVEMPDNIRRIRTKQPHQRIWADLNGKRATVRFAEGYVQQLEDDSVVFQIELGDPIEPRCADPVALFIFATFIGLMLWFSLTKDLH